MTVDVSAPSPVPPFLAACKRQPVPHTPIWIMRQAGRYLPEYRALRAKHDFLTMVRTPELAVEVTLQPVRRFALDAAILFSDILTPLDGLGLGLEFHPAPVFSQPLRTPAAIDALRLPPPQENAAQVFAAIRGLRAALPAQTPLIGFAGAPFTLYCYLVEGHGSKGFFVAKSFLFQEPEAADRLLDKLATQTVAYLTAQAEAGAQALMIFDSWAGILSPEAYARHALPAVRKVLTGLAPLGLPLIYFPNQGSTLLDQLPGLPLDVAGIDWRLPLSRARAILGPDIGVQGNLDPAALMAPPAELLRLADRVLAAAGPAPGHIFNLGHGIEPVTDPDQVARLVDHVHARTETGATAATLSGSGGRP
ncbi:MAG: uroporphyrinogen decarboxylase [Thermoanaerobaculia bacterium]|jgi:uroporphyrinogen decarboxylase|nr:uroporphyrinogen decarboxylase [Thermoanaerobaculia bacterium]MBP9822761.1 uroporphyrinogen decarboxylase [Thermoanaerobaculia bacterium]